MNRIQRTFKVLRDKSEAASIAYIAAGDPSLSVTKELVMALEDAGVDIIELGIPFSDPLADGPTIQAASGRALKKGATLAKIFRMVAALRKKTAIPIVFMTYYNPVLHYGVERFCAACAQFGVDGVIIPDLPYDEAGDVIRYARQRGIATIFLVAPTSSKDRIRRIAAASRGFVYYVSLTGVTGARRKLSQEIGNKVREIQSLTKTPVCVGFGVSNPAQARTIAKTADGVIVGSAIIKIIEKNLSDRGALVRSVSRFARSLSSAIHNA